MQRNAPRWRRKSGWPRRPRPPASSSNTASPVVEHRARRPRSCNITAIFNSENPANTAPAPRDFPLRLPRTLYSRPEAESTSNSVMRSVKQPDPAQNSQHCGIHTNSNLSTRRKSMRSRWSITNCRRALGVCCASNRLAAASLGRYGFSKSGLTGRSSRIVAPPAKAR